MFDQKQILKRLGEGIRLFEEGEASKSVGCVVFSSFLNLRSLIFFSFVCLQINESAN